MKKKSKINKAIRLILAGITPFILMGVLFLIMNNCKTDPSVPTIDVPSLNTTAISAITITTATSGGTITNGGGSAITAKGVCWSTSPSFTIENCLNKTTDGAGNASFISYITGLNTITTYYVRAYAINSTGTGYGNLISFKTLFTPSIGVSYQGGIIAYILQPGDPGYITGETHGLIATSIDQSTGIQWYNGTEILTGASGIEIGKGKANTDSIVTHQGSGNYAAKLCYDLVLGGYSDWYLPSKDELNKLHDNQSAIGGFADGNYWSSSEISIGLAWGQTFASGSSDNSKRSTFYVRPVRAF